MAATCSTNSGNILRQEGFGGAAWDYTYDSLNRMQSATERVSNTAQWQQTYRYDAVGNRALINAPVGTTPAFIPYLNSTPVVSSTSEPMPFSDKNRWSLAAYDLAGNQTTAFGDGTGVGSAAYAYDAENRMIRADPQFPTAPSTSGSILYGYDGDGRRVTKSILQTVNNSPVYVLNNVWVYDALGQLAAEYGESPTMPCTTCYVTADHLGSTRVIWDSAGTIKKLTDYAPFGEEIPSAFRGNDSRYPGALYPRTGGQAVPVEFTGKERDAESGLDYFGARYMSAAQGRFTSPDVPLLDQNPGDPQSWNLYSYVRNNPLVNIDPTGNDCVYVNSGGNGVGSVDNQIGSTQCGKAGGYWVDGTVTNARFAHGSLILTGTTNGENRTSASYGLGADPGIMALQRGTQLAEPGVNMAAQGLMLFGSIVAPLPMALAQCGAGDCSTSGIAMAMLPEIAALKAGGTVLKLGASAGKGAEIIQKTGGVAQAAKDFAALGGTEVINGGVRVRTLADGTRAVLYTASSTKEVSIAIQLAGRTVSKVRY